MQFLIHLTQIQLDNGENTKNHKVPTSIRGVLLVFPRTRETRVGAVSGRARFGQNRAAELDRGGRGSGGGAAAWCGGGLVRRGGAGGWNRAQRRGKLREKEEEKKEKGKEKEKKRREREEKGNVRVSEGE
jgi:UPF0716 family protein affecting phage T7 exclusion